MGKNPVASVTTAEPGRRRGSGNEERVGVSWCKDLGFYSEQWEAVSDSGQQTRLGF